MGISRSVMLWMLWMRGRGATGEMVEELVWTEILSGGCRCRG